MFCHSLQSRMLCRASLSGPPSLPSSFLTHLIRPMQEARGVKQGIVEEMGVHTTLRALSRLAVDRHLVDVPEEGGREGEKEKSQSKRTMGERRKQGKGHSR